MNASLAEKLLHSIIDTSNNNITIADAKGMILQTNEEHWSVYGIKASGYKGKSVFQLEKEGILTPSITALVLKEKRPVQIMQHTQTGKVIMTQGYPIFDEEGKIIRVISYAQDQTEIRNLQEQYEQLERKLQGYQTEVEELRRKEGIHYRSKAMQQIVNTIHRVAESDATVLFLGESGVGKSMFAHELHNQSQRSKEPFIEVNCSTIPESLFESEMFGYEAGSFTGATKNGKQGLIEQAHNGTLFLDEIGELPLSMQVKLLKVLQEKKFMRIGGKKERHVDFRLVTATNQNLEEMVEQGKFRLDLYYRLHVIPLQIPPLRERKDEIPFLINRYVDLMNVKYKTSKKLHPATYEALIGYRWPGNVRELENLMERLILTTEGNTIYPNDLPPSISGEPISNTTVDELQKEASIIDELNHLDLNSAIEKVEEYMILKASQQCKTTYEMAELLGISQPSVVRKLKKYKGVRHHQRTK
ncbi:sigma-54 interaction domain-containing protein [Niallia endozanthoxylica]|uniref:AAA family ATPase n=1 Tax=Niallia endozanthoxylica TaxID=2036016 RepID=A0A5J5I3Y4_9BACI|nr:sigma 54-interacting transcriptional regulator [Niallia endozanthoxylica]KAA9028364.1 AAA family ATPase [Niallia endozanthoxylica]